MNVQKNDKLFPFNSSVKLERVRRCIDDKLTCESVPVKPEYNAFGDYFLSDLVQTDLFLTQYNNPPKEFTKNLISIIAGQQFGPGAKKTD